MFNIVLVEPEIPQNTGNIVRTAAATGCKVHLVKPLGFDISDRALKRAGLDYWHLTDFVVYENLADFFVRNAAGRFAEVDGTFALARAEVAPSFYFFSTKAANRYDAPSYREGDFLIFGKETKGLPEWLLHEHPDVCARLPMRNDSRARSLNLSNTVAVAVYEVLRQWGYPELLCEGHLREYDD